jgi:hypothetical protein
MMRPSELICSAILAAVLVMPAPARAEQYEASQWYSAYDATLDATARVRTNDDGTVSVNLRYSSIEPGTYIVRVVVPRTFRQIRLGGRPIPWQWTGLNVCIFDSTDTRGCAMGGVGTSDLTQNIAFAVVEIWTWPSGGQLSRKWASSPLFATS